MEFLGTKYLSEGYPQRQEIGILVRGKDSLDIGEIDIFYSIKDIHFLHDQLDRRLDYHGKGRI